MSPETNIFQTFEEAAPSRLEINQDRSGAVPAEVQEPRDCFNARQPQYTLKAERPEHRAIIMLVAAGMSYKEVAENLGKSVAHVQMIVKQEWARKQIITEIENAGREPVYQLLRTSALEAAERLVEIARSATSEETKRKANNDILDRVFGKSEAVISVQHKNAGDLSDDELAQIAGAQRTARATN